MTTTAVLPELSPASTLDRAPASQRLLSLDAFRGLIMFTLVCGPIFSSLKGTAWNWLAVQNDHVEWRGAVYWDLIQPSFMFMVGVAMPFALARRTAQGHSWPRRFLHVLIRAFNLCAVGIVLDNIGKSHIQIGFMRVLQQIAFGYIIAFFFVGRSFKLQAIAAAIILVGYHLLWTFNRYNGPGGPWAMGNQNIGSAFDYWMLGRHYDWLYVGMNAIPSTATILFGVMAGQLIFQRQGHSRTMLILLICGLATAGLGWLLGIWFPIIKRICTPTFVLFAGGCTTLMLLAFYFVIEVVGWRRWAFPLVVVGTNSIAAYVMGSFRVIVADLYKAWISGLQKYFGPAWFPVFNKALFALIAWGILYWFYRRKIFFKC